jgi:hypothetical protein
VPTPLSAAEQPAQARQRAADRKVEAIRTKLAAHRTSAERLADGLTRVAGAPAFLRLGLALSADDYAELRAMLQPLDRERLSAELSAQIERAAPPAPASPLIVLGASHDGR